MKLFDRYVALSFLRNYLISFMVLVGMYVVPSPVLRAGGGAGLGLRYWFGR